MVLHWVFLRKRNILGKVLVEYAYEELLISMWQKGRYLRCGSKVLELHALCQIDKDGRRG